MNSAESPKSQSLALEWQRCALREDRQALARASIVALVVIVIEVVLLVSLPPVTALLLGFLLVGMLLPYFLPSQYRVSETGLVVVRGFFSDRREWAEFVSYTSLPEGYLLRRSPAKIPARGLLASRLQDFYLPRPLETPLVGPLETLLAQRLPLHPQT